MLQGLETPISAFVLVLQLWIRGIPYKKALAYKKALLITPGLELGGGFLICSPEAKKNKKAPNYKEAPPPCYSQIWNNGGGFLKETYCIQCNKDKKLTKDFVHFDLQNWAKHTLIVMKKRFLHNISLLPL